MRFPRMILATLAAAAAIFTACDEKEQELTVAQISVQPDTLKFDEKAETMTVELLATRPWKLKDAPEWIGVDPQEGPASDVPQTIEISVEANKGADDPTRKGLVVFGIDVESTTLVVIQEGKAGEILPQGPSGAGTVEDPYNVAKALELAREMDADGSLENVYIAGIISQVGEINTSFGNGTFYISDDGTADDHLMIYRAYSVGGAKFTSEDEIKVGDKVVVFGTLVNFKGNTPEVTQGGKIYSLNGETTGQPQDTDKYANAPAKTVQEFIENGKDGQYYKLTGTVSRFNATYCSFDLTDDSGTIYVYSVDNKADWTDKISNGGTIVLAGKYEYYEAKSQHEVVNAVILSFNGEGGGGGQTGDVKSVTVQEFINAPESSTQKYELVGTIGGSINTQYGNFDLSDDTGKVYVYGLTATELGYGVKNDQSFASLGLQEGDKIKIIGYRGSYNDKVEVVYAYFVEKVTGGNPGGQTGDVKAVTVQEFINAPESSTQKYELVGTIGGSINTQYGNFDLSDDTGKVYVYGLTATELGYGVKNDQSFASLGLQEGDKIKIIGYRGSYNDKVEVVYAYFVEKVTGGNPGGQTGDVKAVSVQEFINAPESNTQKYQLTGTIGGSINTQYGNFDLSDDTGRVYVYGLTATELGYGVKNDQSFASLNLKEGDKITIIGYRGSYQDKVEVVYAYFVEKVSGGDPGGQTGDVKSVSVQEFINAPESQTQKYELVGTIGGSINTTYGNFDLTDDTGTVYVYGLTATDLGYGTKNDKSFESLGLKEGDKIKIIGYRGSYQDKVEVVYAYFVEKVSGGSQGGGGETGEVKTVSVQQFINAPESDTQKYKLTGTIGGSINTTYGNFDLTDDSGTVYVYGLTATDLGYGTKNDKSFESLGLKEGDKITIIGYRGSYQDKVEVVYAYFVEKVSSGGSQGGGGETGEVKTVSVQEFINAAESTTQKYQLTGTIGGSINTTYGNFDLTDSTGSVYVYGLTSTELGYGAKNDKSYESLGLKEGDNITIIGYRGSYNGKVEVTYAYFVKKN